MNEKRYEVISKFNCRGVIMVNVLIKGKAACIMPEKEYNKIIEMERRYKK